MWNLVNNIKIAGIEKILGYFYFLFTDPSLDSGQRIAVLQQKLSELRTTYAEVKAELATVERRRKKIRRREREGK